MTGNQKATEARNMTRHQNRFLLGYIAVVVLCLIGLGVYALSGKSKPAPPPIVEAGGTISLEDKPLRRVRVRFIPEGDFGTEYYASGISDDDGNFTLACRGQSGACSGENSVLIEESEVPRELRGEKNRQEVPKFFEALGGRPLPKKYTSLATSPLKVTVIAGRKKYAIALIRDPDE